MTVLRTLQVLNTVIADFYNPYESLGKHLVGNTSYLLPTA